MIQYADKNKCNENKQLSLSEYTEMKAVIEYHMRKIVEALHIDIDDCHNSKDTPKRVAKMLVDELFVGRYQEAPTITSFPNNLGYDQIYTVGPIEVKSTCAHHWQPITGKCYIGVYPSKYVIGLSKYNRLVDWIARRPQIQEEMTVQIADAVEKITEASGVAVVMDLEHGCVINRGCDAHESNMTTAIVRGVFLTDKSLKKEFYDLIAPKRNNHD